MPFPAITSYGIIDNPLIVSSYVDENSPSSGEISDHEFLFLDGQFFMLLDGENLLLLGT